jgi:hypothetical protein
LSGLICVPDYLRSYSETQELVRLFHPRIDEWNSHFLWNGAEIIARSPIGQVTVSVVFMNDPEVVWLRSTLAAENLSSGQ